MIAHKPAAEEVVEDAAVEGAVVVVDAVVVGIVTKHLTSRVLFEQLRCE